MVDDPGQVADPVAVRVAVAARVDLIDDPLAPPLRPMTGEGRRGRRDVGHRRRVCGSPRAPVKARTTAPTGPFVGCAPILRPMAQSPSLRVARRPLRVGVAGLGAVAQAVHLPLIARLSETFELAAVCDLSAALATTLGVRYGVAVERRFEDVATMLERVELDGLIVLTSGSHGDVALASLERGLPVLCEKPLAVT